MLEIEYALKDIDTVAKQIIEASTSKIFLFDAKMGMGKTTLIKALVKSLGCNDAVSSPTFSLVNEYKNNTESIYHFDLYRIENEEELYNFGFEDYLYNDSWIFIEWPEIAMQTIPVEHSLIKIEQKTNSNRHLLLHSFK